MFPRPQLHFGLVAVGAKLGEERGERAVGTTLRPLLLHGETDAGWTYRLTHG